MTPYTPADAWRLRAGAVVMFAGLAWFIPWMLLSLNGELALLALAYAGGHLIISANLILTAVNNWVRRHPPLRVLRTGEPLVGVLIPTAGEPLAMVERTVRSVLEQDWPLERLRVVVSDDAHRPELAQLIGRMSQDLPDGLLTYHDPEPRHSRRGDGKAGNLNSALRCLDRDIRFIETRDADDEVGDPMFLRHCLGQLESDDGLAFVQTIKTAAVSPGDPFNNLEPIFYNEIMPAKHAANAVFPCGSGVVWRRVALRDIGGFPTWNLVEDLQSGVEALRRGWRGAYVPIVGARAQHAPEDIPNVYKQRGTWALDTMRLLLWRDLSGLGLRQRLHFVELGVWYLQGFTVWALALMGVAWLIWDLSPLVTDPASYAVHFLPFMVSVELFLIGFKGRQPYITLWRTREIGVGLAPVFLRACFTALVAGRDRKPAYRVTRKEHAFATYWREVSLHAVAVIIIIGGFLYGLLIRQHPYALSPATLYWVVVSVLLIGGFARKSWFGVARHPRAPALHALSGSVSRPSVSGRGAAPRPVRRVR